MAYFYVKGKKYRQNNLHLIKPLKIKNRHSIQRLYDYRYQKQFIYILKLLLEFIGLMCKGEVYIIFSSFTGIFSFPVWAWKA